MSVIPPTNQSYIYYWKQRFNEVAAELNIAEAKLARLEGLERAARDWASGKDKGGAMLRDAARAFAENRE